MGENTKEQKNKSRIHIRPILSLLIGLTFITIILLVAMFEAGKDGRKSTKKGINNQGNQEKAEDKATKLNQGDKETTTIVLEIDKSNKTIRMYDINLNEELKLNYTGGTNVLDKYDQVISMDQVDKGLIVDITYLANKNKLTYLQNSARAWEYMGVSNMTIYPEDNIINIAKSKYTYTNPLVVDADGLTSLDVLAPQDELMVRGVDETIWSIIVTKGHGTVRIKDYEAFLGGSITVGYEAVQQITEDMSITVREGNFNLTVENGEYSGTKNITVERNAELVVSVGDLGPAPIRYGETTFDIMPFGADLYIDGELSFYGNPIELAYGEHNIEVVLGGYSTYSGNIDVNYTKKKIQIILPELQAKDPVSIVEIGGTNGEEANNIDYNDWDADQEDRDSLVDEEAGSEDPIVDREHQIYIQSPSEASVYLNGEFKGTSPGSFQKVIGSHVITFIKNGHETKSYTIDIADDGLDTYISLPDLIPSR